MKSTNTTWILGVLLLVISSCASTKSDELNQHSSIRTELGEDFLLRNELRHSGRREDKNLRNELRHKGRSQGQLKRKIRKSFSHD